MQLLAFWWKKRSGKYGAWVSNGTRISGRILPRIRVHDVEIKKEHSSLGNNGDQYGTFMSPHSLGLMLTWTVRSGKADLRLGS